MQELSLIYNNKLFKSVSNSGTGEVSPETVFHYHQEGNIVWATYKGGSILLGNLIAKADENGYLTMRYQHLNSQQEFMTGICTSRPEIMANGKIRLYEEWQWTSGDYSRGSSIIEEVDSEAAK